MGNIRKIVAVGSGSDGLSLVSVVNKIISLTGKTKPTILYLGTATYDSSNAKIRQTSLFENHGCHIFDLKVSGEKETIPNKETMKQMFNETDVVVVSGGNTLFAIDRWNLLGIDKLLKEAMDRGCVMSGGSAGAICWFDGGHSDSMDPKSYKNYNKEGNEKKEDNNDDKQKDESSDAPKDGEVAASWEYIRTPALGFLPGLICPHHDKIQSNGVLRADDFDLMMKRHYGELGIGISHWAALIIVNETYQVMEIKDDEKGYVVRKKISNNDPYGIIETIEIPSRGLIRDVLEEAKFISQDVKLELARDENPSSFL